MRAQIWAVLGIPATADKAAIRRAYALRMRKIDMEAGRDAFVALRAAYEMALAYEEEVALPEPIFDDLGDCESDRDKRGSEAVLDQVTKPIRQEIEHRQREELERQDLPEVREARELRAFLDDMAIRPLRPIDQIEDIVAHAGVAAAWKVFLDWMANGEISLREQNDMTGALFSHAVKDERLPREIFIEMTKVLGVSAYGGRFKNQPALKAAIDDRLEAYRWFDNVKADASRKPRGSGRHKIRAARSLLQREKKFPRSYKTLLALKDLIETYRTHERFLHDMIEPEFLAPLEARTTKVLRLSGKLGVIFGLVLFTFGLVVLTLALLA